jgi:predicted amidophosphoribosyltransferase
MQDLGGLWRSKPDVIIPVPLHHRKQKKEANKLQPLDLLSEELDKLQQSSCYQNVYIKRNQKKLTGQSRGN